MKNLHRFDLKLPVDGISKILFRQDIFAYFSAMEDIGESIQATTFDEYLRYAKATQVWKDGEVFNGDVQI